MLWSVILVSSLSHAEVVKDESMIKQAVGKTASGVISLGKNLITGVSEGVTDGRKSGEAVDGAIIVSNLAELEQHIETQLLTITNADNNTVVAEFAFRNSGKSAIRLINLEAQGALLIMDREGFAYNLAATAANPLEITIPERSAVKRKFLFEGKAEEMKLVRLWGKDFTR